jgi:hypothetical protein
MQIAPIEGGRNKKQFVIKMTKFRHKITQLDENFEQD